MKTTKNKIGEHFKTLMVKVLKSNIKSEIIIFYFFLFFLFGSFISKCATSAIHKILYIYLCIQVYFTFKYLVRLSRLSSNPVQQLWKKSFLQS